MSNDIQTIGVIGAGRMGTGIAQVFALAGFDVQLIDSASDSLERSTALIDKNLVRQTERGTLQANDARAALARIKTHINFTALKKCDLVVEAISEREEDKKALYQQICPVLKKDAILTSNTSSISITRLAAYTDRPGKFAGMHFMNPVPKMELVELIRGIATDEDTYNAIKDVTHRLHKISVNVEDFPAFIVNRILLPMINEAVYTLYEGVGSVDAIDTAMKLGANHPMGPLELADFIGLDVCLSVMHVLHDGLADSKYRPCPLLVKYVEAGWLGRKTGRGFYDYSSGTPVPTR